MTDSGDAEEQPELETAAVIAEKHDGDIELLWNKEESATGIIREKLVRRKDTKRYSLACRDCGFEFWADYHKGLSCPSCGEEVPLIQYSPSGKDLKSDVEQKGGDH